MKFTLQNFFQPGQFRPGCRDIQLLDDYTHFNIFLFNISCLEWEEQYFNRVWPKWKDGMHNDMKEKIKNIGKYKLKT